MKGEDVFLYGAFALVVFFVLNKTTLQPSTSAPLSAPPPTPPAPGTPAAAPSTATQAAAAPATSTVDMNPNDLLSFGPYGY